MFEEILSVCLLRYTSPIIYYSVVVVKWKERDRERRMNCVFVKYIIQRTNVLFFLRRSNMILFHTIPNKLTLKEKEEKYNTCVLNSV